MCKSYTNEDFDTFLLEKPDQSSELLSDSNDESDSELVPQAQGEGQDPSILNKRG